VTSPPLPKGSGFALATDPLSDLLKARQRSWCTFDSQPIPRDYNLRYVVLSFQGLEVRGSSISNCVIRVNLVDTAGSCRFYNSSLSDTDIFRIHDGSTCVGIPSQSGTTFIPPVESLETFPVKLSGRTTTNLRIYVCEPDLLSKPNLGLLIEILEAPLGTNPRARVGWAFLPFSGNILRKHRLVLNRFQYRPPGAGSHLEISSEIEISQILEHRAPLAAFELAANFPEIAPSAVYLEISEISEIPNPSSHQPVSRKVEISEKADLSSVVLHTDPKLSTAPPAGNFLLKFPDNSGGFSTTAFSPSGSLVAFAARQGLNSFRIEIFELSTKSAIQTFLGHTGRITEIYWFDDKTLASSGVDGLIKIWSLLSAAPALILPHPGPVLTLHADISGDFLAAAVPGFGVKLWRGAENAGNLFEENFGNFLCARFSLVKPTWLFVGTSRGFILLAENFSILTAYSLNDLTALAVPVHDLQPADEAMRLKPGCAAMLLVSSRDSVIRLVGLPVPDSPTVVVRSVTDFRGATCINSDIRASLSADGRLVASGSECGNLFVWDAASGKKRMPGDREVSMPFPIVDVKWSKTHRLLSVACFAENSEVAAPALVLLAGTEEAAAEVSVPTLNTGWHLKWAEKEHALGNNVTMKLKAQILAEISAGKTN